MYVSVLEYMDEMPQRTCAVFGLEAVGYGKAYAPSEQFSEDTLTVSRDASKVMRECEKSGYETVGGGIGIFVRIIDAKSREEQLAHQRLQREQANKGSEDPVVMYQCSDCDEQLVTLMNGIKLTRSQSSKFVPLMQQAVSETLSMIKRRNLRGNHRDLGAVIRKAKRRIWESTEADLKTVLQDDQWGAFEVLQSYLDQKIGVTEGGLDAEDSIFDWGNGRTTGLSSGSSGLP